MGANGFYPGKDTFRNEIENDNYSFFPFSLHIVCLPIQRLEGENKPGFRLPRLLYLLLVLIITFCLHSYLTMKACGAFHISDDMLFRLARRSIGEGN